MSFAVFLILTRKAREVIQELDLEDQDQEIGL